MISLEERLALDRGDFAGALEAYERHADLGVRVDMRPRKKGRVVKAEVRPRPGRLSPEDVREIRRSEAPHTHVARFYGVSASQVSRIRNYESYRWVGG